MIVLGLILFVVVIGVIGWFDMMRQLKRMVDNLDH